MKKLLLGLTLAAAAFATPALAQSYSLSSPHAPNTAWNEQGRDSYAYEPGPGGRFDGGMAYDRGEKSNLAYGSVYGPAGMPQGGANAPYTPPHGSEY